MTEREAIFELRRLIVGLDHEIRIAAARSKSDVEAGVRRQKEAVEFAINNLEAQAAPRPSRHSFFRTSVTPGVPQTDNSTGNMTFTVSPKPLQVSSIGRWVKPITKHKIGRS